MPNCFWNQLCDCPDKTPAGQACMPHGGNNCSIYNGQTITNPNQINDATTVILEAAIAAMDGDRQQLTAIKVRVDQLKTEVEEMDRVQRDLEQELQGNPGIRRRVSMARQINRDADTIETWKGRILQLMEDIDAVAQRPVSAINRSLGLLVLPYSDPNGYCACYQDKIGRLNVISGLITRDQALLAQQQARIASMKNAMAVTVGAIAFTFTLGLRLIILAVFSKIGLLAAVAGLLVALAIILSLMVLLLLMVQIAQQVVATKRRLLVSILFYYRLQQIPVCIQGAPPGAQLPDPFDWLREFWGQWYRVEFEEERSEAPEEGGQDATAPDGD